MNFVYEHVLLWFRQSYVKCLSCVQILGFEKIETPDFGFGVIWLKLSSSFALHLIERDPATKLPEGPWSAVSAVKEPSDLPRGHHIAFSVANFESFVDTLKVFSLFYLQLTKYP